MRDSKLIRLICLLLSFVLAFTLLSACKTKPPAEEPDTSSDTIDDDYSDDFEDDYSDDYEDDYLDDSGDDDYIDAWIPEVRISNAQAPISTKYRGHSSTLYHAFGYMLDDITGRVYTDEERAIEADRLANAGIRFTRTMYSSHWAWNYSDDNFDFKNSDRVNYFFDYCNAMQDRGIEVILHIGWDHKFFVTGSATFTEVNYLLGNGQDKNGESVGYDFTGLDEEYTRLAKASNRIGYFYAQTILEARSRGINNTSHLLYFVEPSVKTAELNEGPHAAEYYFMCKNIKAYLEKQPEIAGTLTHIGPNQGSTKTGEGLLRYCIERDPKLFDIWTTHFYPSATNATDNVFYDVCTPVFESYLKPLKDKGVFGKTEFWVDEFDCRDDLEKAGIGTLSSPWLGLQNIVGYLTAQQLGINNVSDWMFCDQLWTDKTSTSGEFVDGIHMCGMAPSLLKSTIPYAQYYYVYLFSRYNGYQNGTTYKTNIDEYYVDGLYSGVVQLEDGNWTVTIANLSTDEMEFNVYFDRAINKTLYRHLESSADTVCTTAARLADADKTYLNVKDKFTDTIPAGSLAIYTSVKG